MSDRASLEYLWVRTGACAGLVACAAYPALILLPLPVRATALLVLVFAAALFVFNFATFPLPPADAGLVDVGPLVGLWYLAVTIQVLRSLSWARGTGR